MTELRTLKDLKLHIVDYLKLQAEAVKWIKEMQGIMYDDEKHYSTEWIKHFFNLPEEDLKEVEA